MFVATSPLKEGRTCWGWDRPDRVVVARIRDLANAAIECTGEIMREGDCSMFKVKKKKSEAAAKRRADCSKPVLIVPQRLFVTPLVDYDVIIRLDPAKLPRYHENLAPNPKYFVSGTVPEYYWDAVLPLVGFDPVKWYLKELAVRVRPCHFYNLSNTTKMLILLIN
jgi:hypothetical protein